VSPLSPLWSDRPSTTSFEHFAATDRGGAIPPALGRGKVAEKCRHGDVTVQFGELSLPTTETKVRAFCACAVGASVKPVNSVADSVRKTTDLPPLPPICQ
jgi:hypothetical protein